MAFNLPACCAGGQHVADLPPLGSLGPCSPLTDSNCNLQQPMSLNNLVHMGSMGSLGSLMPMTDLDGIGLPLLSGNASLDLSSLPGGFLTV